MTLRLWMPPMGELRSDSEISFDVLDKNRRVQHRATSTVAALSKNSECELVLAPSDVVLLEVRLPRLRGAKLAKALPALVEDKVISKREGALSALRGWVARSWFSLLWTVRELCTALENGLCRTSEPDLLAVLAG